MVNTFHSDSLPDEPSSPEVVAWVARVVEAVNEGWPEEERVIPGTFWGDACILMDVTPVGGRADDVALHPVLMMGCPDPDVDAEGMAGTDMIVGTLDEAAVKLVAPAVRKEVQRIRALRLTT